MAIGHCRHHPMVLTIMMVVVNGRKWAHNRPPELLRTSFCAAVRTEREYGTRNLAGALQGSLLCGRPRWARRWY
eukprot:15431507-Alexandrium_andersonii.AAC.1